MVYTIRKCAPFLIITVSTLTIIDNINSDTHPSESVAEKKLNF